MTTTLEHVARAVREAGPRHHVGRNFPPAETDAVPLLSEAAALLIARAAIRALAEREPTFDMLDQFDGAESQATAAYIWRAMLAQLAEECGDATL